MIWKAEAKRLALLAIVGLMASSAAGVACYRVDRYFSITGPIGPVAGPCDECEDGDYCNPSVPQLLECGPAGVVALKCRTFPACWVGPAGDWMPGGVPGPWAVRVPQSNILRYLSPGAPCPSATPGPGGED